MNIIAKNEHICIREMEACAADFEQHLRWMTSPEVLEYWDGEYDDGSIREMYYDHMRERVTPCFIELDGRAIGYVQFDRIPDADGYECPEADWARFFQPGEMIYGVDMFIAADADRNRGIGTQMLTLLSRALFEKYGADALVVDPKTHNARAIACYHKCGFKDCFVVPQREAHFDEVFDSLIMRMDKPNLSLHNPDFCRKI